MDYSLLSSDLCYLLPYGMIRAYFSCIVFYWLFLSALWVGDALILHGQAVNTQGIHRLYWGMPCLERYARIQPEPVIFMRAILVVAIRGWIGVVTNTTCPSGFEV